MELMKENKRLAKENRNLYDDIDTLAAELRSKNHQLNELEANIVVQERASFAPLEAEHQALEAAHQALQAEHQALKTLAKHLEDNDNCQYNRELAGLDASLMKLEHERDEALKLVERLKIQLQHAIGEKTLAVIAPQDEFVALQDQTHEELKEELQKERDEAAKLAAENQSLKAENQSLKAENQAVNQGAEPESDNHCLQRTGGMKPALVQDVRLHLKTAKETGNNEALCAYLTEKSQRVVLTVFEDIFIELKLPIPNKGAKRPKKLDYLVMLSDA